MITTDAMWDRAFRCSDDLRYSIEAPFLSMEHVALAMRDDSDLVWC